MSLGQIKTVPKWILYARRISPSRFLPPFPPEGGLEKLEIQRKVNLGQIKTVPK